MNRRPFIIALTADLMDRSKISGAFPEARVVRSLEALATAIAESTIETGSQTAIALIDLGRITDPSALGDIAARVIAFGSHVNEAALNAAQAAGVEALPRSVFFRRLGDGSLI